MSNPARGGCESDDLHFDSMSKSGKVQQNPNQKAREIYNLLSKNQFTLKALTRKRSQPYQQKIDSENINPHDSLKGSPERHTTRKGPRSAQDLLHVPCPFRVP